MDPTIHSYYRGAHDYAYAIVTPNNNNACVICREPYTDEHAIRLTHCGHIVGLDCFRLWTQAHPNTCVNWNHHLPYASAVKQVNLFARVLAWAAGTKWFISTERRIIRALDHPPLPLPQTRAQLKKLHADSLSLVGAVSILSSYCLGTIVHALATHIFATLALSVIYCCLWTVSHAWSVLYWLFSSLTGFRMIRINIDGIFVAFRLFIFWACVAHGLAFMLVVSLALVRGMYRTYTGAKQRTT